jgi:hypothetical protein
MGFRSWKRIVSASWVLLIGFGVAASVYAAEPGQVQWTFFQTVPALSTVTAQNDAPTPIGLPYYGGGNGDNILRLINPNGAANANLAGATEQTVCAMIYVFDSNQEMGECCGCPLSSTQLATFSVYQNLTANWSIGGPIIDTSRGSIAITAAAPNAPLTCLGQSGACNGGCDPTNIPGYSLTAANNLLGSMTHNQFVPNDLASFSQAVSPETRRLRRNSDLTEASLFDDSSGDPNNVVYLQNQCGAIVGNGTGGGICTCPTEG